MAEEGVGAVAVVESDQLRGIFTERDVMLRGVLRERRAVETKVGEVMTTAVETTTDDTPYEEALNFMLERHIRHLPIVTSDGQLKGMLSIRNLLEHMVQDLQRELHSLDQYLLNDGPGG
jgi:CBS domain-containing protein